MLRVAHELSQRAVPFITSKLYDLVRYVTENNDTKGIILVCMRQRQDEKEERKKGRARDLCMSYDGVEVAGACEPMETCSPARLANGASIR